LKYSDAFFVALINSEEFNLEIFCEFFSIFKIILSFVALFISVWNDDKRGTTLL